MKGKQSFSRTTALLLCALFAALTAVFSAISIPLPFTPVPVNLATLSVLLAGGLLGARYGSLSQTVYVLLGVAGAPVFHNFTGGLGILSGPTGGYIIGYIAAAFIIGFIYKDRGTLRLVISLVVGVSVYMALGTVWFMLSTGAHLLPALVACVFPFLLGDLLKIITAIYLIQKLSPYVSLTCK